MSPRFLESTIRARELGRILVIWRGQFLKAIALNGEGAPI